MSRKLIFYDVSLHPNRFSTTRVTSNISLLVYRCDGFSILEVIPSPTQLKKIASVLELLTKLANEGIHLELKESIEKND